jgi:hypothetical protein
MKAWYWQRAPRERLLLLIFLTAAAVVWLASVSGRIRLRWQDRRQVTADLAGQKLWLDHRGEIEQRAGAAAARLDPARTLDANHLVGEVSALAAEAGLSAALDAPRTQRSGQFAYHTVQVGFHRAELGALVKFYRALARRAPYLGLEECSFAAGRANPAEIEARLSVFSVEVKP